MTAMPPAKRSFVARFRYSLRALLIVLAVCGLVFGLWKRETRRHERELRAVSQMRSFGVNVDYRQRAPQWLRYALGDQAAEAFETVEGISFPPDGVCIHNGDTIATLLGIDDGELAGLRASLETLPNLKSLNLSGTRITDAAIEHVTNLAALRELDVSGTNVSEKRIEVLCREHPQLLVKK
jgi:hypothetical protein